VSTRYAIRVVVQVGEEFGSVVVHLDGEDDAFDEVDMVDLAEIAARRLVHSLTEEDEDDDWDPDSYEVLMLPSLKDDDDDDDDHTLN